MLRLDDKLYTSTEVADILGVSLRSVYRYLEENKLQADIKTATGRHRFSKRNILEFLYPDGSAHARQPDDDASGANNTFNNSYVAPKIENTPIRPAETVFKEPTPVAPVKPVTASPVVEEKPKVVVQETAKEVEVEEEPIDWLAKFREAAKKYREEADKVSEPVAEPVVVPTKAPIYEAPKAEPFVTAPLHVERQEIRHETRKNYYRSSLGGLKDIAQNIDKGSRSSFLDYAFTLNAGLSLYKPIKPFSVLHAYVRPGDLTFFERSLGLTPTEEHNAQLCLLVSDDNNVYSKKDELHGLFVVSKERLLNDIKASGDVSLENDGASILSN